MIKNLIFDVGKVLMTYRPFEMMEEHGLSREEAERIVNEMFTNPYWKLCDYGTVPYDELTKGLQTIYPDDAEAIGWFFANAGSLMVGRPKVWEKLHELKEKGYKIYILSNYEETLFKMHTDGRPFMQDMDGAVVSYAVHMAKPEERIYRYLLDTYGLKAEECLYFDDLPENCGAAAKLGINTYQVKAEEPFLKRLEKL